MNVHIVTDSSAHFTDARLLKQYPITVVPNKITIGSKSYHEKVDISTEEALHLIAHQPSPPTLTPPSAADFLRTYSKLANEYDAIISIHTSREINGSWANARRAAQQLAGQCNLAVVDSQSICVGQGMLVRAAAKAAPNATDFEALVRTVRGTIERIYSIYYVETMESLLHNKIISPAHGILGTMLSVKPFLTIENGQLIAIEKVRTRLQAIERLVEFVVEFEELEEAVILQHKSTISEQTRMLQDRLTVEFPGREFVHSIYGAALAVLIGADASGVVILESEGSDPHYRDNNDEEDEDDDDEDDFSED